MIHIEIKIYYINTTITSDHKMNNKNIQRGSQNSFKKNEIKKKNKDEVILLNHKQQIYVINKLLHQLSNSSNTA